MNLGAELLAPHVAERGAQKRLAEKLGIDQGNLSRYARGKEPGLPTRRIFKKKLGIPLDAWDQPAKGSAA